MSSSALPQTLIILSGLPGSGKTTLAQRLLTHYRLPILAIDDIASAFSVPSAIMDHRFWEEKVDVLLHLVDSQLSWGNSVLVDSVFMGQHPTHPAHPWNDRQRAHQLAKKHQVRYRPIYLFVSDEKVWQARLADRASQLPDERVATWAQVDKQRHAFEPWQPGQALFLDSLNNLEHNIADALSFISAPAASLEERERLI